jgi:hypothetical protein
MTPDEESTLRRILAEVGLDGSAALGPGWWLDQAQTYRFPALPAALLLRQLWRAIVAPDSASVGELIDGLRRRAHDDDSYPSAALRQAPQMPEQLAAAMQNPEMAAAIVYLVRAAQIEAVGAALQSIDGGAMYEDGLAASWALFATKENDEPCSPFGNLEALFYEFDPARRGSASR